MQVALAIPGYSGSKVNLEGGASKGGKGRVNKLGGWTAGGDDG